MPYIDTVVIGAGQAGLAASRCLTDRGIEHVVLERGRVAHRWFHERWDSLHLLTPNWMSRLPGWHYDGDDPNGFMTAHEAGRYLAAYADASAAPVLTDRTVRRVAPSGDGRFTIDTDVERWCTDHVIVATGWCERAAVPAMAERLAGSMTQIDPAHYRNPTSLPDGGVLVVGASATGVQLAHELAAAGRPVTIAVGNHSRVPRRYRGVDIFWWLSATGTFDRTIDEMPDPVAARREPSLQLVGRPDHAPLDLAALVASGVRLVGRLATLDGTVATFAGDLRATVAAADARLRRVLTTIDAHVEASGLTREVGPPDAPARLTVDDGPGRIDLRRDGITSVLWATGHERSYDWLDLPVLDDRGEIVQHRGVTAVPGCYVLGLRFQHRRRSNFIDGVGRDAEFVADHLLMHRAGAAGRLLVRGGAR